MTNPLPAEEFYRQLADEYDEMTRASSRREGEKRMLADWVKQYKIKSALDAACGSGLHAGLLAELGINVVGADLSAEMLQQAREHYPGPRWVKSSLQALDQYIDETFDAVFCLGNSIPHLLTDTDMSAALNAFRNLTRPGGVLVLQLLNYTKILANRQRIVGIHRAGEVEFIRFYDFEETLLRFNILSIRWREGKAEHRLQSTLLFPYRKEQLHQSLLQAGFVDFEFFGDMNRAPFSADKSSNLIVTALGQ